MSADDILYAPVQIPIKATVGQVITIGGVDWVVQSIDENTINLYRCVGEEMYFAYLPRIYPA